PPGHRPVRGALPRADHGPVPGRGGGRLGGAPLRGRLRLRDDDLRAGARDRGPGPTGIRVAVAAAAGVHAGGPGAASGALLLLRRTPVSAARGDARGPAGAARRPAPGSSPRTPPTPGGTCCTG